VYSLDVVVFAAKYFCSVTNLVFFEVGGQFVTKLLLYESYVKCDIF
jgi:hypothetical protein